MSEESTVGMRLNGHTYDGTQWVPSPDPGPAGARFTPNPGDVRNAHTWNGYRWMPMISTADPAYAYALTRQTSDDLQFIARFTKIMIWVWIVLKVVGLLMAGFAIFTFMTLLGSLPRLIR